MNSPNPIFKTAKPVIAMIHLGALPGTPASRLTLREIEQQAVREAEIFRAAGVHALLLENMHDTPYLRADVLAVKRHTRLPVYPGSGVTAANVKQCSGVVDNKRVARFMKAARAQHSLAGGVTECPATR